MKLETLSVQKGHFNLENYEHTGDSAYMDEDG